MRLLWFMKSFLSLLLFLTPSLLLAELSVPHFFSDHMILQRDRAAAIWGTADAGAEVSVNFKGKSASAKAAADGKWRAQIETGTADAAGAVLTISAGAENASKRTKAGRWQDGAAAHRFRR